MQGHIHLGMVDSLKIFTAVVVVGFFWRTLAAMWHAYPWGRAMAFIY